MKPKDHRQFLHSRLSVPFPAGRRSGSGSRPELGFWTLWRVIVAVVLVAAFAIVPSSKRALPNSRHLAMASSTVAASPAQYALTPLRPSYLHNARAVEKAVQFLLTMQPEGTYVLTSHGVDDVVHMDVAHAAIALVKTGYLEQAEAAMTWMLALMTMPGSPDQYGEITVDDRAVLVDYAGSWYDHFYTSGDPKRYMTRGRGEGVGLGLVAVHTIYQEDPEYLRKKIDGVSVAERVALAVGYLTSPAIQRPDGRFNHRPDYRVSFGEEAARMALGLRLGAAMLDEVGEHDKAEQARRHANLGLEALRSGQGLNHGMAFDYYAMGIWGLATPEQAREELRRLERAGMVTPDGVRNWDWQLQHATNWRDRIYWWLASQSIGPSQTFDWIIASAAAGNLEDALRVERRWLRLQRDDGSFAGCYVLGLRIGVGPPNSFAIARFILMERMLMEILSPIQVPGVDLPNIDTVETA